MQWQIHKHDIIFAQYLHNISIIFAIFESFLAILSRKPTDIRTNDTYTENDTYPNIFKTPTILTRNDS